MGLAGAIILSLRVRLEAARRCCITSTQCSEWRPYRRMILCEAFLPAAPGALLRQGDIPYCRAMRFGFLTETARDDGYYRRDVYSSMCWSRRAARIMRLCSVYSFDWKTRTGLLGHADSHRLGQRSEASLDASVDVQERLFIPVRRGAAQCSCDRRPTETLPGSSVQFIPSGKDHVRYLRAV